MLPPMLFVAGLLLVIFYGLDRHMCAKEDARAPLRDKSAGKTRLEGKVNLLLLLAIVGAVLLSGVWKPGVAVTLYHVPVALEAVARDGLLLAIVVLSLALTPKGLRAANHFNWEPMFEVAKLFIGIFLTIVPAIAILRAGESGALGAVVSAVTDEAGQPIDAAYFWLTGALSSFLDNAPTYLVFFNTAGGDAAALAGPLASTLLAISAGAVFMGANTYIGNAPNFMVRAHRRESRRADAEFLRLHGLVGHHSAAALRLHDADLLLVKMPAVIAAKRADHSGCHPRHHPRHHKE